MFSKIPLAAISAARPTNDIVEKKIFFVDVAFFFFFFVLRFQRLNKGDYLNWIQTKWNYTNKDTFLVEMRAKRLK